MSAQQTLTGDSIAIEYTCEAHGDACTEPAETVITFKEGAAEMDMAVCENCRNVLVGWCDELLDETELTEPMIAKRRKQ